ncbi:hypothetical protein MMC12_006893 [Toensbergia leucococca]|nr:hypothetical protein [Toensbergia leucococca]
MCIDIETVHSGCGHARGYSTIEHCPSGTDLEPGTCLYSRLIHTIQIDKPSLCTSCFRRHERNIFGVYMISILEIEGQIHSLRIKRRAMYGEEKEECNRSISVLEETLGDLKDQRAEEIAEFRAVQGVWAVG